MQPKMLFLEISPLIFVRESCHHGVLHMYYIPSTFFIFTIHRQRNHQGTRGTCPPKLLARRVRMDYIVHLYVVPMWIRRYYALLFMQNISSKHTLCCQYVHKDASNITIATTGEPHSHTQHHTTHTQICLLYLSSTSFKPCVPDLNLNNSPGRKGSRDYT